MRDQKLDRQFIYFECDDIGDELSRSTSYVKDGCGLVEMEYVDKLIKNEFMAESISA